MPKRSINRWFLLVPAAILSVAAAAQAAAGGDPADALQPTITNAAAVRSLPTDQAARGLPVRLGGVVTYVFDARACFVQDASAGIFIGNGVETPGLTAGDLVEIEGVSGSGEYAPVVEPAAIRLVGRTNLPPTLRVSYEELLTGRLDSQWVEVAGVVRAVFGEPTTGAILEIASGSGKLTAFVPSSTESNLAYLVDSEVRVRGVCGTWFNKQRQLFGIRLMVPRVEDVFVEETAPLNAFAQPALPIGNLLRFDPRPSPYGRRVKVAGTVILHQPGRALFVQDEEHGLCVQTRQSGRLHPGDQVELLGFPAKGDYTPMLEDAEWRRIGSSADPAPVLVRPDEALGGLQDSRLVAIEGRLLDRAHNSNGSVLLVEADDCIFSAHFESPDARASVMALEKGSRLRLTGVCRIEVGDLWRAGPAWRAKSFRLLLRSPADIQVLELPPWWTLTRLLWAVGLLVMAVLASLTWATQLRRKVNKQTNIIRRQLEMEATLKERYQDLFENANDMVYTQDLSGRLTSINLAGERLLGSDRETIVQRRLLDLIAEDQRFAASQWHGQVVDGTAPATVEWDFVAPAGARLRLEISTRLIKRGGKPVEIEGIARDVTERRRLEKEILEVSTREQRRIGHDLHDGVCQQLAGIAFLSDTLADRLQEQRRPEAAEAEKITELVHKANKQTRGVARGLFPIQLEENGLVSALEELVEHAGTFFGTRCEFHCDTPILIRDETLTHHLYYIAQEAILNAVKHGHASHIAVRLETTEHNRCHLVVRDDGVGFAPATTASRGMGIRIMKYRARMIGAEVRVGSCPGGGAEMVCEFTNDGKLETTPASSSALAG
jgi:PAS domain S-box-containing protein